MEKTAKHAYVYLDEITMRKGIATLREAVEAEVSGEIEERYDLLAVSRNDEGWQFDTIDELLAELVRSHRAPDFNYGQFMFEVIPVGDYGSRAILSVTQYRTHVVVGVTHSHRAVIERVHEVFRSAAPALYIPPATPPTPEAPKPRVFIGHGGKSTAWNELKDHLAHKQKFEVEAYETGARAGHTIRDILEEMLAGANFAILVMTAEDEQADGAMRARQNVVHEAGLFQGKLGFARAIIVIEDGVDNLSNLDGVQYLPFKHTIAETFGDIVATIRREFGE